MKKKRFIQLTIWEVQGPGACIGSVLVRDGRWQMPMTVAMRDQLFKQRTGWGQACSFLKQPSQNSRGSRTTF
jgi:hypothetical protein